MPETMRECFQGPSLRKFKSYEQEPQFFHDNDESDFYQIIYNSGLLQLVRNVSCQWYLQNWSDRMHFKKREGSLRFY